MINGKKIIAIIPARKGSKGLPGKNIKLLNGLPLISYSIAAALDCKFIDKVVVSTDSEEIKATALKYGAEVPFIRPDQLSTDTASSQDVLVHAIDFYKSICEEFQIGILLQPTSPLRNSKHIKEAMEIFLSHLDEKSCTVISVSEQERKFNWLLRQKENGTISFIQPDAYSARQSLSSIFLPNGAIYIFKTNSINEGLYTDSTYPYLMSKDFSIDIDDMEDFKRASAFIESAK